MRKSLSPPRLISLLIGALFLCSCTQNKAVANDQKPQKTLNKHIFDGGWINDRGSAVYFTYNDGLVSGHYQTNLGQPDRSKKFPLTGFIESDQISFSVNFKGFGSITSWTGQLSEDEQGPFIRTLWHLTRDVPDTEEDADLWKSITAGASTFRPIQ